MRMDNYYNWEKMGLQYIVYLMVKWFLYDTVNIETIGRVDVESGIWITITVKKEDKEWLISGQRVDVVHRRLIEFLDSQNIRQDYKQKRDESDKPT